MSYGGFGGGFFFSCIIFGGRGGGGGRGGLLVTTAVFEYYRIYLSASISVTFLCSGQAAAVASICETAREEESDQRGGRAGGRVRRYSTVSYM